MSNSVSRVTLSDPPVSHPPEPTRFLLVRHGQSTWNDQRRIQGQLDPPLSELGREQARRVAGRLAGMQVAGFYCSDLARTRETAAEVARALHLDPVPVRQLREVALGDWEGLTAAEIAERYPDLWQRWLARPSWDIVPGSEGSAAFEDRVRAAIDDLALRHPSGNVVVVTHGGVIQVALAGVIGSMHDALFPFVIDNCSISTIVRGPRRSTITGVNDTGHLATGASVASSRERGGGLGGRY